MAESLNEVKAIIKSLVMSDPCKMTVDRLSRDFRMSEGRSIPHNSYGYQSLESFLLSLKDAIYLTGSGPYASVECLASEKSRHMNQLVQEQNKKKGPKKKHARGVKFSGPPRYRSPQVSRSMSAFVRDEQQDVFAEGGSGAAGSIPLRISALELKNANMRPPLSDSEDDIDIDEMKYLNNIFRKRVFFNEMPSSSTPPPTPIVPSKPAVPESDLLGIPLNAITYLIDSVDFPKDAAHRCTKIPSYTLPPDVHIGTRCVVYITQVHSPFKFWFHFDGNNILDDLMFQMESFYENLREKDYCVPAQILLPGQICAANYNGRWYRAEVLEPARNKLVKVLYVDYGTVADLRISYIKYLKIQFTSMQRQAMRGCLSHIKPLSYNWSTVATMRFLEMVEKVSIHAQITDIHETENVFYMVQCRRSIEDHSNPFIQVNKTLIDEGYALIDREWPAMCIKNHKVERSSDRREHFPTFGMLEKGQYPTLSTLQKMQACGIDYEYIVARRYYNPCNMNIKSLPFPLLNHNPFSDEILAELIRDDDTTTP